MTLTVSALPLPSRQGSLNLSFSPLFEVGSPSHASSKESLSRHSRGHSLQDYFSLASQSSSSNSGESLDWTNPRRPDLSKAEEGSPAIIPDTTIEFIHRKDVEALHPGYRFQGERESPTTESSQDARKNFEIITSPSDGKREQANVELGKSMLSKVFGRLCLGSCLKGKQE